MNYKKWIILFMIFMGGILYAQPVELNPKNQPEDSSYKTEESINSIRSELQIYKEEMARKIEIKEKEIDLLWTLIAAFLVFFMQAGFALLEAGFTRAKNTVNILMKNISDFTIGSLAFWFIGFGLMFGPQLISGFGLGSPWAGNNLSFSHFFNSDGKPEPSYYAFFLFQCVFAGTATTIASGAMAERTKFISYLGYSLLMTAIVYPIFGSLVWKGLYGGEEKGFLEAKGFIDFAGSTVVHSVGGWAGLAGTLILKPRLDRYHGNQVEPIFGHNMSLATLGVFILWFGWFGFNPGSTGTIKDGSFAVIALTTNMAAAAGILGAMLTSWAIFKLPDIGITLNGGLAGLVAITAGCNNLSITTSILVGFLAGIIVVCSVLLLDKWKIDDPVGAVSVHGVGGAWGTIAVGLFASPQFGGESAPKGLFYGGGFDLLLVQMLGVVMAFVWAFGISTLIFLLLKHTIGLRVTEDEEIVGLDILEHGNEAYPTSK
jgi:Amt family ammonium transporter